jgi:hypothetical protein
MSRTANTGQVAPITATVLGWQIAFSEIRGCSGTAVPVDAVSISINVDTMVARLEIHIDVNIWREFEL